MIEIELTESEQALLLAGINEWSGPAALTDELALAMGFADRDDLHDQQFRLREAVKSSSLLTVFDWARIQVMAEIVFVSDMFGSGLDWRSTTGILDSEAIETLRHLQRKFLKAGVGRRAFAPGSHQEFQWHAKAATAIRMYKSKRSDLSGLIDALSSTTESFGGDLADLKTLQVALEQVLTLPEIEQRNAALVEFDRLAATMADRSGGRARRICWI